MAAFVMRLAGLTVRVEALHDEVVRLCRDYMIGGDGAAYQLADDFAGDDRDGITECVTGDDGGAAAPDLTVQVTEAMIEAERAMGTPGEWSDPYLETLAVFRSIGERLPLLGRAILHGATIEVDGSAYVFTAPSGTGKSTHIRLWRQYLGQRVHVINGDKPIVQVVDGQGTMPGAHAGASEAAAAGADGSAVMHATPWAGKEGWQTPRAHAPLAGVCFVARGHDNTCRRMAPDEALPLLLRQLYMPSDPVQASATLGIADRLLTGVPMYLLHCDISKAAVQASYGTMCGNGSTVQP